MREVLCVCSLITRWQLRTHVTLLMHVYEARKTTNTGRIAELSLERSKRVFYGERDRPLEVASIFEPGHRPYFLFPASDAIELTPALHAPNEPPLQLIVPDGTWAQTRRMVKRLPELARLPRVKLPAGAPSAYQLRHSPHPERLSTYEAIARALGILERAEVQRSLEHVFDILIERTLWSRGKLALRECRHPVPEAALREFYEAGCRAQPVKSRAPVEEPS